jgi:hypothetical protein
MPNWKKLIVSGSDASLNSLNVTNNVTAQSFTGSFSGSFTAPGATTQVVYNNGGVLAANSGFVYSGSNVGIGISAPTEKLHIVSSATGNQFGRITATDSNSSAAWVAQNDSGDNVVYRVFSSGVSGTQMGSALGRSASLLANLGGSGVFLLGTFSNTNFVLGTNNTERMRITTAGDVGIGNTSPNDKLDVSGNVSANAFNAVGTLARYNGTGGVAIAGLGGSSYAYILAYSDSSGTSKNLALQQNGGNVGIGTTAPSQVLEVQGQAQIGNDSVTSAGLFFARKNTNQAKSHYFLSAQESPTYQWIEGGYFTSELAGVSVANNSGKPYYESYSPAGQYKSFGFINQTTSGSSFTSTAATASMTLYQGGDIALAPTQGNVGIGTTNPSYKLDVAGNIIARNTYPAIYVDHNGTVMGGIRADATTKLEFKTLTTAPLSFQVNSDEKMRITDGGNVGIGTTSPGYKLDISTTSGTSVFRTLDTTTAYKSFSIDYSSNFITQVNFGLLGRFEYEGNGGVLSIENRSTQAGSSMMRFVMGTTERMRITDTGNVGIGTTSPSEKLHVVGDVLISDSSPSLIFTDTTNNADAIIYTLDDGSLAFSADENNEVAGSKLLFYVDGGEKVRITDGGNVGIGTNSPSQKLAVVGAVSASTYYGDGSNLTGIGSGSVAAAGSDGQLQYNNSGLFGGASRLYYNDTTNKVGIGTSSPGYDLDVSGSVRVQDKLRVGPINTGNGVIHQSSDATINASSSTIVWSVPGSSGAVAFIEYYIINTVTSTSQRGGNIVVTWNSAGTPQITHTETTTPDIGTTALVTFTTSITLGGDPQLVATNTSINPFYIVLNYRYF